MTCAQVCFALTYNVSNLVLVTINTTTIPINSHSKIGHQAVYLPPSCEDITWRHEQVFGPSLGQEGQVEGRPHSKAERPPDSRSPRENSTSQQEEVSRQVPAASKLAR